MFPIKPISDRTLYGPFNLQSVPDERIDLFLNQTNVLDF